MLMPPTLKTLQVRANVHAHFIVHFENGQGHKSFFFYIHAQNTAETSEPQTQPMDD